MGLEKEKSHLQFNLKILQNFLKYQVTLFFCNVKKKVFTV